MPDDAGSWMVVGQVVGAFGLAGELKMELLTDFPERITAGSRLYLGAGHTPVAVQQARRHKSLLLLKLEGVDTVEAAEKLRGREVAVPRSEAVDLPAGHYFLEDLIGIQVQTPDGTPVGEITEVLRTGSNDVYVVGRGRTAVLIPGTHEAVADLDLTARRLVVEPWVLAPLQ